MTETQPPQAASLQEEPLRARPESPLRDALLALVNAACACGQCSLEPRAVVPDSEARELGEAYKLAARRVVSALLAHRGAAPPRLWECPRCGFAFDAVHVDEVSGEHSCPVCREAVLEQAFDTALVRDVADYLVRPSDRPRDAAREAEDAIALYALADRVDDAAGTGEPHHG